MIIKNRKAVSPVIATVILVAVAITISVAVAYWMGGISSQYTKFEKVEVTNAIVTIDPSATNTTWIIVVKLKNTGTAQATITNVFVNDRQLTLDAASNGYEFSGSASLPSGAEEEITITLEKTEPFENLSSGTTVSLKFHSAGGMDYLKLVELV